MLFSVYYFNFTTHLFTLFVKKNTIFSTFTLSARGPTTVADQGSEERSARGFGGLPPRFFG